MGFMKQYEPQTYALLRIVSGFLFIFHGIPKLQKVMAEEASWMLYIAGPIEVIGGAIIMIGLYTSAAAFLSSGLMAGAYWLIHYSKMGGGWPINNDGDAAVLFCFLFLYIAAKGSGIWSVDGKRS
jgi:putative oxidoreductase|tara:strand:+ start:752 stop:1126 length:375 start_codon:yes stop_codon:yes gene_type:complete